MTDARAAGGPVFIIGPMGSGTTLLRLMLDSHEHIAIPQETGFMRAYDTYRFLPFKHSGRGWTKRLGWAPDELDALLRAHFDTIFMRYAERHGKRRWGEKTPLHTWHIDDMARVFPDAQFVGMVRHPCASVQSNVTRFSNRLGRATTHWGRYTAELARQAARHPDRFRVLRYEDLVLRPEPVARELLEWLDEPWDDAVLEHHEVQAERGGRKKVEGRSRVDEAIDVSRVDKWTRTMPAEQQQWVAERLWRHAQFFGYEIDQALPAASLAGDGRDLATGQEIDARIEAFADLDLRTQREVPVAEVEHNPRDVMLLRREDFEILARRRGLRRVGVFVARRMPEGGRLAAVRAVRGTRAAIGLRRRPKRI